MSWCPPRPNASNPPNRKGDRDGERVYDSPALEGGWAWSEQAHSWMRIEYLGTVDGIPTSEVYPPESFRCPVCKWFDTANHVPGGLNCRVT